MFNIINGCNLFVKEVFQYDINCWIIKARKTARSQFNIVLGERIALVMLRAGSRIS